MPLTQTQQDVLGILKKADHVLVLPSSPLDGDSLGSSLAFYLALKKLGKEVTVVAEEAIPASYNFLPEIASISRELKFIRDFVVTIECQDGENCSIRHEIQGNKINIIVSPKKGEISKDHVSFSQGKSPYDCIVTVDAADPAQFGNIYENFTELFHLAPVINIDHHASNLGFGKINLVDVMASATTVLVLPLIEELGSQMGQPLMDADIATLLLAGLITDTGSFQNPNTTPDAFGLAAKLIGYGARQQEIIRNIYKTKKLSTLRLWGRTLTKIQYDEKHRLVWSVLSAKDFAEIGSSPNETEGVIDELMSNAPGSEIIFLLKEKSPTEVSGSIRTLSPTIDSSKLAGFFGGGGHVQAAGFKMLGKSLAQVETEVVSKLREYQKTRLKLPDDVSASSAGPSVVTTTPPAVVPQQAAITAVNVEAVAPVAPAIPALPLTPKPPVESTTQTLQPPMPPATLPEPKPLVSTFLEQEAAGKTVAAPVSEVPTPSPVPVAPTPTPSIPAPVPTIKPVADVSTFPIPPGVV